MKILLADDENLSRQRLRDLLQDLSVSYEVVGEAVNGKQALELTAKLKPDVILLDINMPVLDGICCARELSLLPDPPAVIFVTAHDDFALQAFEVAACDYLLKPLRAERLEAALAKTQRFTQQRWNQLDALLSAPGGERDYLCAQQRGGIKLIPIEEIMYFQADQKYTTVKTEGGEALIEDTLKSLEQQFDERFVRIHRNALVAINRIERLDKTGWGGGTLVLRGLAEPLEVSRRCLPGLRARLLRLGQGD